MWEIIQSNRRKSVFLVIVMAALLMSIGYFAGELLIGPDMGISGIGIAGIVWLVLSIAAYYQGKSIFLAVSGAVKIKKEDHPRLFNVVEEMTIASMLPAVPEIYIIDDLTPNAFSLGRDPDHAAVAITSGLLNVLDRDQLQGVIAHEIAHVRNRDTLFMTMIGVMMGAIVLIADVTVRGLFYGGGRRRSRSSSDSGQFQMIIFVVGLILMILAPVLARLVYLAASRKREYLADASAVEFTRLPDGLAGALEKIGMSTLKSPRINRIVAPMCIVNPLEKPNAAVGMFSTHPPIRERVKILRAMVSQAGDSPNLLKLYDQTFKQVTGDRSSAIPASALQQLSTIPAVPSIAQSNAASPSTPAMNLAIGAAILADSTVETPLERARETSDAIWKSRNYRFLNCPCGASLKIPPALRLSSLKCLRCHREHPIPPLERKMTSNAA